MAYDPIGIILHHEGGYSNHPADKGGPTKFGVTQATYARWLGRRPSIDEVKAMTVEVAREIYEKEYLAKPRIDTIPEPPRTMILDMAINHGPRNAIRMLQRVVNAAGFGPITLDGRMGPMTRKAVENAASRMGPFLQNAIVEERIRYYHMKVEQHPPNKVFLKGWLRRAESFRIKT